MEIKIEGTMDTTDLTQDVLQVTPCRIRMEESEDGDYEYTGESVFSIEGDENKGKVIVYTRIVNPDDSNETNIKANMQRQARDLLSQMANAQWDERK